MAPKDYEYAEGPGIVMERHGRFMRMRNIASADGRATMNKALLDRRQGIPAELSNLASQLEAELTKFDPFTVLAHMYMHENPRNADTYKEYSFSGKSAYVEYAALLLLKRPYPISHKELTFQDLEHIRELIDEIYNLSTFYFLTERLESQSEDAEVDPIQEFRTRTITHNLIVRNPGYEHHLSQFTQKLFGNERISRWMEANLGFTIHDALEINNCTAAIGAERLWQRRQEAKGFTKALKQAARRQRKGKDLTHNLPPELVAEYSQLTEKRLIREARNLAIGWMAHDLSTTLSFTLDEVVATSGCSLEATRAYLEARSLNFGSIPETFVLPTATPPLAAAPVLHHNGRYLTPVDNWLDWGLKPFLEQRMKDSSSGNDDIWETYQSHRADVLETESLNLISHALKHARTFRGLEYVIENDGTKRRVELDGLIDLDRALILLEAKAGAMSPPAHRGAQKSLREELTTLIGEAHSQGLRAREFILASDEAIFDLDSGDHLIIRKDDYDHIFIITVSLESLETYTSVLNRVNKLGILGDGPLPWAVSYFELIVICEILEFPSQLIHFLLRRSRLNEIAKVVASDELDWFGHYLLEGLYFEHLNEEVGILQLMSYTTMFDDYYLGLLGYKSRPVDRPTQKMPDLMRKLMSDLEDDHAPGYLVGALTLLSMDSADRARLVREFKRMRADSNANRNIHDLTFVWNDEIQQGLTLMTAPSERSGTMRQRLHRHIALKKYELKSPRWSGVGSVVDLPRFVHEYAWSVGPWQHDPHWEQALEEFHKRPRGRSMP
jgi:hypothetical protein